MHKPSAEKHALTTFTSCTFSTLKASLVLIGATVNKGTLRDVPLSPRWNASMRCRAINDATYMLSSEIRESMVVAASYVRRWMIWKPDAGKAETKCRRAGVVPTSSSFQKTRKRERSSYFRSGTTG
jgi:hypothetical protein